MNGPSFGQTHQYGAYEDGDPDELERLRGECHHGCSGSPSCTGDKCTWMCHRPDEPPGRD